MADNSKIKVLEQRINKLENQVQNLSAKRESKKQTKNSKQNNNEKDSSKSISRREFMKKAGLGSAGLAALISPVSAGLLVRDEVFTVETGTGPGDLQEYFRVNQGASGGNGTVEILNTDLQVQQDVTTNEDTTIWDSSNGEVPAEQVGIDLQINGEEITGSDTVNFKTE